METIFLPFCLNDHWRLVVLWPKKKEWTLMDPIGEIRSEISAVENGFIKEHLTTTGSTWSHVSVQHERQPDQTSCGIFVIKFAYNILGDTVLDRMPLPLCRRYLADKIVATHQVSLIHCAICKQSDPSVSSRTSYSRGEKHRHNESSVGWIECDWCDRWVHDVCASHPSQFDFKCQLCSDICSVYGKTLPITVCSSETAALGSQTAAKIAGTPANLSTNLADSKPFEILILEKTKARKCGGCENSLILRGKQKKMGQTTIGLRRPYTKVFFNRTTGMHQTVDTVVYLHSRNECFTKVDPTVDSSRPTNFLMTVSCYESLTYHPAECNRFENEFHVLLKDIPLC